MADWPQVHISSSVQHNIMLLYLKQRFSTSATDCPAPGSAGSLAVIRPFLLGEFYSISSQVYGSISDILPLGRKHEKYEEIGCGLKTSTVNDRLPS